MLVCPRNGSWHSMLETPLIRNSIFAFLIICGPSNTSWAGTIINDPMGFNGIEWGSSLLNHPQFIQIDSENDVAFYRLKKTELSAWGVPVESMKFLTLKDKFAQVLIHYRGEAIHRSILNHLESSYGKNKLSPGSMMRGLNQQYSWRGSITEISITYRELTQRGFITIQSQILAAGLMNAVSDQLF